MLRVLKCTWGNGAGKRNAEEDCWSFVMKKSCAWQILGLKRQTKGKSLIVLVDVEQQLILWLGEGGIQKVYKGCKSDSMGTSALAGGRKSR